MVINDIAMFSVWYGIGIEEIKATKFAQKAYGFVNVII